MAEKRQLVGGSEEKALRDRDGGSIPVPVHQQPCNCTPRLFSLRLRGDAPSFSSLYSLSAPRPRPRLCSSKLVSSPPPTTSYSYFPSSCPLKRGAGGGLSLTFPHFCSGSGPTFSHSLIHPSLTFTIHIERLGSTL